jgi:hypothetical protein
VVPLFFFEAKKIEKLSMNIFGVIDQPYALLALMFVFFQKIKLFKLYEFFHSQCSVLEH